MRRYKPFLLLVGVVFLAVAGCATHKNPCKPFRKKIDCLYFEHRQCREELNEFGRDFLEEFNRRGKRSAFLTVNTGEGEIYNLKYRMHFEIPAIYIDITHCVNGEVVNKERRRLGLFYGKKENGEGVTTPSHKAILFSKDAALTGERKN